MSVFIYKVIYFWNIIKAYHLLPFTYDAGWQKRYISVSGIGFLINEIY